MYAVWLCAGLYLANTSFFTTENLSSHAEVYQNKTINDSEPPKTINENRYVPAINFISKLGLPNGNFVKNSTLSYDHQKSYFEYDPLSRSFVQMQ
jgi:hypothetical protein